MRNRTQEVAAPAVLALAVAAALIAPATAQLSTERIIQQRQIQGLWLPNASPRATLGQTIGLTDVEIVYHRPAVNERKIWGGLVPYGQVWRTGANENTLISFSSDVSVEGQALPAGTYGLHSLPGEGEWQIIFSKDTTAWGSFSYSEEQDALRVGVKPEEAPFTERMAFIVDEVDSGSATFALRWEKLRVPFKVEIDEQAEVMSSIRSQLKGLAQFTWLGWNQAANYALNNDGDLEEALTWADNSIQGEERFENLTTKSRILAELGQDQLAEENRTRALDMANAGQLHNLGRQLIGQGKKEEAMAIFRRNVEQNPDAWFVQVGMARGHAALEEWDAAVESMRIAHERAPEAQKAYIQGLVEQLARHEGI